MPFFIDNIVRPAMLKQFLVAWTIAAALALPAAAQTGAVVSKGPGVVGAAQTVHLAATITAIDPATRSITLKGPEGKEVTVNAGPEVKNFAQMKVGDQVNVAYTEALTLELKKGGEKTVARTEQTGAAGAKPGDRPAGVVGRQVTVVADVIDVNAATQTITLRGPQRTVELKVRDPEQFKLVAKGDQVEATYTEAVAVEVTPAAKK
jgi:hypothetical protein